MRIVLIQAPQISIDGQVIVQRKAPVLHIEVFGNVKITLMQAMSLILR